MTQHNRILAAAVAAAMAATGSGAWAAGEQRSDAQQDKAGKQSASQGTGAPDKSNASQGASKPDKQNTAAAPVVVLVPFVVATEASFADGCWARLYDGQNFQGDQLSLVGPVDMPTMRTAFGKDWGGEFDSIEVGPKATLTVYDKENYAERAATFRAKQRVADLDEKMGLFEDVRSLKIACAGGAKAAQSGGSASRGAGKQGAANSGISKSSK